jgi:hypothetical protein
MRSLKGVFEDLMRGVTRERWIRYLAIVLSVPDHEVSFIYGSFNSFGEMKKKNRCLRPTLPLTDICTDTTDTPAV